MDKTVFIPILTRNHNNYLKHYLRCIDELDYPKDKIIIYINTNNNDDDSVRTLLDWTQRVHKDYKKVIFEHGDYSGLNREMGWQDQNGRRLHIMSIIRQRSLDLCKTEKCDYFFPIDTDNWVEPITLKYLIGKNKPLIAPFLKDFAERTIYSNFFYAVNPWGFIGTDSNDESRKIWHRKQMCGTFEVPLVHCTYLLDCNYIDKVKYHDGSNQWEFITFANSARENEVKQYLCNERMFGFVRYDTVVDSNYCYDLLLHKAFIDNDRVTSKDIIFVGFSSSSNKNPTYANRRRMCEQTWLKKLDTDKYFPVFTVCDPSKTQGKNYHYSTNERTLYINAPDSWESCYDRTRYSLEWAMNETTSQHFWKVDDDSYVNCKEFNKYDIYKNYDYLGIQYFYKNHCRLPHISGHFMHGAGYCVSRRIIPTIVEQMVIPPKPEYDNHEDYDLGYIVCQHIPDASVYCEYRIHSELSVTSPSTLIGTNKIDGLLIGHKVEWYQMTTMHKYYYEEGDLNG